MGGEVDSNRPSILGTNRIEADAIHGDHVLIRGSLEKDKVGTTIKVSKSIFDTSVELFVTHSDPLKAKQATGIRVSVDDLSKKLGISKGKILWAKFLSIFSDKWSAQALVASKVRELSQAENARRADVVAKEADVARVNKVGVAISKNILQALVLSSNDDIGRTQNAKRTADLLRSVTPEQANKILSEEFNKLNYKQIMTLAAWGGDITDEFNVGNPNDKQYLLEFFKTMHKSESKNDPLNLKDRILDGPSGAAYILKNIKHASVYRYVANACTNRKQMEETMTELIKDLVSDQLTPEQRNSVFPHLNVNYSFMVAYLGDKYIDSPKR